MNSEPEPFYNVDALTPEFIKEFLLLKPIACNLIKEISPSQDFSNVLTIDYDTTYYAIMKTMYPPPSYHNNGFVATHAPQRKMYGYTLLVPMNQSVLTKESKERNISGHK